uniref:Uncharacterized protein n=1 Tax=Penaeus semisulcatus majanivirus TaxID=2984274 RepID=A0A9C7CD61_9VIRU|nr:MAG: hypothetical protein [Penaeus semisulcatus majanivirus]
MTHYCRQQLCSPVLVLVLLILLPPMRLLRMMILQTMITTSLHRVSIGTLFLAILAMLMFLYYKLRMTHYVVNGYIMNIHD